MADYRHMVAEIHKRGMKIYLDQEIQYVAYGHPWYSSTLGKPGAPYSDFLIWHGPGNTNPEEGPFGITIAPRFPDGETGIRSEEHTSELQSLMRISYAVFCLKKKTYKHDKIKLIQIRRT